MTREIVWDAELVDRPRPAEPATQVPPVTIGGLDPGGTTELPTPSPIVEGQTQPYEPVTAPPTLRVPAPAPPTTSCTICGRRVAGAGPHCDACSMPLAAPTPRPRAEPMTVADAPVREPIGAPSPSQGAARRTMAMIIVIVVLAAAGTGAYLAFGRSTSHHSSRNTGGSRTAKTLPAKGVTDSRLAPVAGNDTAPGADAAKQTPSDATTGHESPQAGDPVAARTMAIEDMLRAHFDAIDSGDYDTAYALFASGYGASQDRWIREAEGNAARIGVQAVRFKRLLRPTQALVFVDIVTRDAGASTCHRFAGKVLAVEERGVWRYLPGKTDHGATFGALADISDTDPRCSALS